MVVVVVESLETRHMGLMYSKIRDPQSKEHHPFMSV